MAGSAKPDIEGLGKEVEITILGFYGAGGDNASTLLDGDVTRKTVYGNLYRLNDTHYLEFSINKKSNIYAYGNTYSDSAGSSGKDVILYRKEEDGSYTELGTYSTPSTPVWQLLFEKLDAGTYKMKPIAVSTGYVSLTELYAEMVGLHIIKKDNKYYSIKEENYYDSSNSSYNEITDLTKDNFNDYVFPLSQLFEEVTIGSEIFKPIDKFDNFQLVSLGDTVTKIQGLKANKGMVVGRYSFSTRLAKNIDFFELVSTISDDSSIKMAVSIDTGTKWKVHNGTDWVDLTNTCPLKNYADMTDDEKTKWETFREEVFTSGMDAKTLNTIDFNEIKDGTMMFAYVFDRNSYADTCEMSKLQYQFDANGSYRLLGNDEIQISQNASAISIAPKVDMDLVKVNVGSSGEVTINQGGGEIMITEEEYQEDWSEIFG